MKIGIVGLGPMGQRHIEAYKRLGIEKPVLCDISEELLSKFPDYKTYKDAQEMFSKENLDAVSIVTTGPSHAKLTILAAESGVKRIFCEKPMATKVFDAERMIEACVKNGVKLVVNHGRRFHKTYRKILDLIEKGTIGDVRQIYITIGGGRIGSIGTHYFDLMRFLLKSDPKEVIGRLDKNYKGDHKGRNIFDPGAFGIIIFENGSRGIVDIAEDIGIPAYVLITGSVGRIIYNELENKIQVFARKEEHKKERLGNYTLPLEEMDFGEVEKFDIIELTKNGLENLLSDEKVLCSGQDGLKAVEMSLAFHLGEAKFPIDKNFEVNFT